MPPLLLDGLANLFPVRHPGLAEDGLHVEAALQLADQHVDLDIAGTGEDHLVGLTVVDQSEGGVLLVEAV